MTKTVLILAMAMCHPMHGDVIFTSFAPYIAGHGLFTCCAGNGIGFNGESAQVAAAFTPSSDEYLNTMDFAIYKWAPAGSGGTFNLGLYPDAGGHPGSIPLETWLNQTAQDTPDVGLNGNYVTVEYESFRTTWNGSLSGGHQYWFVASPIDSTTSVLWNSSQNLGADVVEFTSSGLGGVWTAPQTSNGVAFDVIGFIILPAPIATPEPVSGVFVLVGLAAVFLLHKMRRASSW